MYYWIIDKLSDLLGSEFDQARELTYDERIAKAYDLKERYEDNLMSYFTFRRQITELALPEWDRIAIEQNPNQDGYYRDQPSYDPTAAVSSGPVDASEGVTEKVSNGSSGWLDFYTGRMW